MTRIVLGVGLLAITTAAAQSPQEIFDRAVADFAEGRVQASARGFDRVASLLPDYAPQLWQRGIVLYYVGRYNDCREQFELHRTVNPNDVENAAWHFLCVAREEGAEHAREALLPVGPDVRVPMSEIYGMFSGFHSPDDVLAAAGGQLEAQFYANLYVGLYFDALGRTELAREHIAAAAADHYTAGNEYMYTVARVHLKQLRQREN